jgi:mRNA-degrading endonuclease toxin of MazEF toxin-antitoxin module
MGKVKVAITLDEKILGRIDRLVRQRTFSNRSQAQSAGFPLTYELKNGIQAKKAWIKIGQIRTLSNERVGKRIGQVSPEELAQIIEGSNGIVGD